MSDENVKPPEDPTAAPENPSWEYRKEFGISTKMKEIIRLSMAATQSEINALRRKLERLQYGS